MPRRTRRDTQPVVIVELSEVGANAGAEERLDEDVAVAHALVGQRHRVCVDLK